MTLDRRFQIRPWTLGVAAAIALGSVPYGCASSPATSDPTHVRQLSAQRYGADPAEVDQALADRHSQSGGPIDGADKSPIGRRRRS